MCGCLSSLFVIQRLIGALVIDGNKSSNATTYKSSPVSTSFLLPLLFCERVTLDFSWIQNIFISASLLYTAPFAWSLLHPSLFFVVRVCLCVAILWYYTIIRLFPWWNACDECDWLTGLVGSSSCSSDQFPRRINRSRDNPPDVDHSWGAVGQEITQLPTAV